MKKLTKRILSTMISIAMLLSFPVAVLAEGGEPLQHDLDDGSVVINTCEGGCPGHIIDGPSEKYTGVNIQILSGAHSVTLKEMTLQDSLPPSKPTPEDLQQLAGIYLGEDATTVDLTVEGTFYFTGEIAIYSLADALNINLAEDGYFTCSAHHE